MINVFFIFICLPRQRLLTKQEIKIKKSTLLCTGMQELEGVLLWVKSRCRSSNQFFRKSPQPQHYRFLLEKKN